MSESFFLGPHAENDAFFTRVWGELLQRSLHHRRGTFSGDGDLPIRPPDDAVAETVEADIAAFLDLLQREVPTFSNRYLGHMVSDVSIPALIGNVAVLFCNPNLASKEVAAAGTLLETRAINRLAEMIGLDPKPARGHFTSGGTLANFEAFWRARYRFDHWLSMAAWLLEHGHSDDDLFTLAHQGWDRFRGYREAFDIDLCELQRRSYVVRGPWDIARYYRDTLQREFPEPVVLVPGNKHYSWPKSANVFGISENAIWPTALDRYGRVSLQALQDNIERARREQRPILMAVSVAGTTELGTVDPLDEVAALLARYRDDEGIHIWHHVDAAYGGYLCASFRGGRSELAPSTVRALSALPAADSVTLDPHKLGFVPYACGAFLVRDPQSYAVSHISAPYLREEPDPEFPTWSTTLEGSRAATGAGAVLLSSHIMPLNAQGHGAVLNQCLRVKARFAERLAAAIPDLRFTPGSDTNILGFAVAPAGARLSAVNLRTAAIVDRFVASPNFAVSRTSLGLGSYRGMIEDMVGGWEGSLDDDHLLVVRMVIMNPYLGDAAGNEQLISEFVAELQTFIEQAA